MRWLCVFPTWCPASRMDSAQIHWDRQDDPFILAGPNEDTFGYVSDSLYRQAAKRGADVLLCGIGGDDCVSGHAPSFLLESLLRLRLDLAWQELRRLRQQGMGFGLIGRQCIAMPLVPLPLLRWRWKVIT